MAKYRKYSYDQGVMVPVDFSKQIVPGTLEYTIHLLVENKIDFRGIESKYNNDHNGAPAYNPAILLKVVLLACSRGIISSGKIVEACRENIVFMALSADSMPDFTTIAAFIRNMKDEVKTIFTNVLLVCSEMELLGGTEFALDGCKISSNAAKENSGTFRDLELKKEKIEKFLTENKQKQKSRGGESQSNITDNESAKIKTSHGVLQGSNGMALVDAKRQVVVNAEAFGSGHEHELLVPMIEGAKRNAEEIGLGNDYYRGKRIIADTGSFKE